MHIVQRRPCSVSLSKSSMQWRKWKAKLGSSRIQACVTVHLPYGNARHRLLENRRLPKVQRRANCVLWLLPENRLGASGLSSQNRSPSLRCDKTEAVSMLGEPGWRTRYIYGEAAKQEMISRATMVLTSLSLFAFLLVLTTLSSGHLNGLLCPGVCVKARSTSRSLEAFAVERPSTLPCLVVSCACLVFVLHPTAGQMGRPRHISPSPGASAGHRCRHIPLPCLSRADSIRRDLVGASPSPAQWISLAARHSGGYPDMSSAAMHQDTRERGENQQALFQHALTCSQTFAFRGLFEQDMAHCLDNIPSLNDPVPGIGGHLYILPKLFLLRGCQSQQTISRNCQTALWGECHIVARGYGHSHTSLQKARC